MSKTKKLPKLKFNKNIVPSVEESIPTKELLVRLKELSNELTSIHQDKIDISSLDHVKNDLINKKLIRNNNMGVQSYVSCCLSDILRIYAPDAPFTLSQLTDIFKLFFNQFKHLHEQETNGCFPQYYYLLSKLAEVRSIILITDLPDSEKLIETCFDVFYSLANQPSFPLKLEPLICDILSEIISESDTIPMKVLKMILSKFLSDKGVPNTVNPSLNFTLSICNTNTDRISRLITQYFSEVIYDGSRDESNSSMFIENLNKFHRLSIAIWRHIPELLASVMGLIEDELETDDVTIRLMATETVSKIIAIYPSNLNFIQTHSDTYTAWLKKTLDISVLVRCKWVETTLPILLSNRPDIGDIVNGITKGLLDNDEKVRLVTCKTLAELPPKLFLERIASETIMSSLSQLIREKHSEIRNEIIKLLGNVYNDCWDEERDNKLLNWIPDRILNLNYINDKHIIAIVDLCLMERLLPFESNSTKRVQRLLFVIQQLSEKSKSSFFAILKRQQQIADVMLKFLEACELYNGGQVVDGVTEPELHRKLDKITDWLTMGVPTYYNAKICLERFVKLNNRRFYRLIKLCISADSDYETIKNSMKELFNKIIDQKNIKIEDDINVVPGDMLNVFKLLLYRSSLIVANKSNIPEITERANDASSPFAAVAMELLECISTNVPGVFKSHIHELTQFVMGYTGSEDEKGKFLPTLKTIYHFLNQYRDFNELLDIEFYDKLFQISLNGSVQESKYSVRIICLSRHKYSYTEDILGKIYPLQLEDKLLPVHLSIIAEFYLQVPTLLEDKSSQITTLLIKEILLTNTSKSGKDEDEDEDEESWIDDDQFERGKYLKCEEKLLTLQIFTNRLISILPQVSSIENEESEIEKLATPVFKLLMSLIGSGGEIVKSELNPTPKNYQSKLRLFAGLKFLDLFQKPVYNKMLTSAIMNRLVFLVQDECLEVRSGFVDKLEKLLNEESIGERFFPLLYFTAHEPEEKLKSNVKTWLKTSFRKHSVKYSKGLLFEKSFVRLLHMVAHHQEYVELMENYFQTQKEDELVQAYCFALEYICFFLQLIGNQDNISLLYYFSQRVKQYRDNLVSSTEYDQFEKQQQQQQQKNDSSNTTTSSSSSPMIFNIYRITELAQLTIKQLAHHRGWILSTYPGKFNLSPDLFSPILNHDEAQRVVQTAFIETTVLSRLETLVRAKITSMGVGTGNGVGGAGGHKRSSRQMTAAGLENKENIIRIDKKKKTKNGLKRIKKPIIEREEFMGPVRKSGRNVNKSVNYVARDEDEEDEN